MDLKGIVARRWRKQLLSAEEADDRLKRAEELLHHLQGMAEALRKDQVERLESVSKKLDELKGKVRDKEGKPDTAQWNARPEAEHREIGRTLDDLFHELRCLNQDELRLGRIYFVVFFGLLILLSAIYVGLHARKRPSSVELATVIVTAKHLRSIELDIDRFRKAKDEEKKAIGESLKSEVKALREIAKALDLSAAALQLLGAVESEAEKERLAETDTFDKLRRMMLPELESLRSAFLWNDRRGRWFEIAWWAELGTVVGILFYIAGLLSGGRFPAAEIAMFWTEVVIAPIVVLVIFFLFALTGITGISPQETSITGNVGFAFIFGFAIRRTLGLLDIIKKRIFPDPTPT